ncbi:hypothetical protein [Nostoc sp. MS1]|uniref:hypothetical protein n=1 Tax=Nostoc sp. MS1 TaxID=2764711 RepID=UPI001CC40012|nr:hypothetical protein [Nostoc sp. MS1]BCL39777.1 hypothetical protein NSMS1_62240 [Nostoc sp. MS1]
MSKHKYSSEYLAYIHSPQWKAKSKQCQQLTLNHCVFLPWHKSNHAHHLTYNNLEYEMPVRDIVPLSNFAHEIVHLWFFWNTPVRSVVNWLLRLLMLFCVVFWQVIWVLKQLTKLMH